MSVIAVSQLLLGLDPKTQIYLCFLASLWELKHAGQEGSFDQVLSFHSSVRKMPGHVVGHVCPVI